MNSLQIRVAYADTDQMGMVYYGNYLVYFERGRTEWMRECGFPYTEMEKRGFFFPVLHAECKYITPARYDDLITIETKLTEVTAASITCSYEIKRDGQILAKGSTKHPFVDKTFKPVRFPKDIKAVMEKNIEK